MIILLRCYINLEPLKLPTLLHHVHVGTGVF
jgi:hypothetical protein